MTERIVAAAIRIDKLVVSVEAPGRHHDILHPLDGLIPTGPLGLPEDQGFLTSTGRFVGREEGRKIAEAAGQLIASCPGPEGVPYVRQHPQLFSEDVW